MSVVIQDLAVSLAEAATDRHPEKWQDAQDPTDLMGRTIAAEINLRGWEPGDIDGALTFICNEIEAGTVEARRTFNDFPCQSAAAVRRNPAGWYISDDAAERLTAAFIPAPTPPMEAVESMKINRVIAAMLVDLQTSAAEGGLKPEDAESRHAGVAAAIDEQQLLKFIRELAGDGRISPRAPQGSTSSEVGGDWTLTVAHRQVLRTELIKRIDETAKKADARHQANLDRERQLLEEKRAAGRYTLKEAAAAIGEDRKRLLEALLESASAMTLPIYNPGEKIRIRNKQGRVTRDVEAYWHDLNDWIIANEPKIEFRFPDPGEQSAPATIAEVAPSPTAKKQRRNVLDQVIDAAIEKAGSRETAAVWVQLKELAVSGTLPFTGETSDRSLGYTNARNKPAMFKKKALGQRLRRVQEDR